MRRVVSSVSVGITLLAALAIAGAPHLVGRPTTTDNGNTLTIAGSVVDLAARDARIQVVATGIATVSCTNPGGNESPGQNKSNRPVRVTSKGEQTVLISELVNGVAAFSFTTGEPIWISAEETGCPNDQWTAQARDVTFKTATIRVSQDGYTLIKRTFRL